MLAYKIIDIFHLKITASGIIFSLAFIFSTLITEVYGFIGCEINMDNDEVIPLIS